MPASCGHCNLQCYLCLRRVNPMDGTCKLHTTGTKSTILNTSQVCSDHYSMGGEFYLLFSMICYYLISFVHVLNIY